MKDSDSRRKRRGLAIICVVILSAAAVPFWSSARSLTASINISIVNNSSRELRHLYLSPADNDNWGAEQLHGAVIAPGASYTLSNAACDGQSIKVIAEDQNGCFLYQIVSCSDNATWTITNEATVDCGG